MISEMNSTLLTTEQLAEIKIALQEMKELADVTENVYNQKRIELITKDIEIMEDLIILRVQLVKLFDEYYSKQLELTDNKNVEYYTYMGMANGIGQAIDLIYELNKQ